MERHAKTGCSYGESDINLIVPIQLTGDNNEHIKWFETN